MMQIQFLLLALCLLISLPFNVCAQQPAPFNNKDAFLLQPHLSVWVPKQTLSIEQVAANADQFTPITRVSLPALGKDVWYRLEIDNKVTQAQAVINFSEVLYEEIDLYYLRDNQWIASQAGLARPYDIRDLKFRLTAFTIFSSQQNLIPVYFRIKGFRDVLVNPTLQPSGEFFKSAIIQTVISTSIIGSILGMLIYILVTAHYFLDRKQSIIFSCFLLSTVANVMFYDGYIQQLTGDATYISLNFHVAITALLNITSLLFCRYFFDLKRSMPWLNHMVSLLILSLLGVIFLNFAAGPNYINKPFSILASLIILTLLTVGIKAYRQGQPSSGFYVLAILSYSLTVIYTILASQNIIFSFNLYSRTFAYIGTFALAFFVTMALNNKLRNSTEREEELSNKALLAEARNSAKSEFLANMSHEIRTPINGVLGMAQLLHQTKLDSNQSNYVDILLNSGKTLLNIINDILDISKVEAGKLELEHIPFSLDQLLVYTSTTFSHTYKDKPIEMGMHVDSSIPYHLIGDSSRLQQILNNLMSNAYKFTERGHVDLHVNQLAQNDNHITLNFVITDTGIGIHKDKLQTLFTPYTQADQSTTRRFGGTGLGLAICKNLVELMNGTIQAKSTLGSGSEFSFSAEFIIDQKRHQQQLEKIKQLDGKKLGLLFSSPKYLTYMTDHFTDWHITHTYLPFDSQPDDIDFLQYDALLVSNSMGPRIEQWLNKAIKLKTPIVIVDSFTDNYILISDGQWPQAAHMTQPAGVELLLNTLTHLFSPRSNSKRIQQTINATPRASHLKVLVAEDNVVNKKVIDGILKTLDIHADFANNGQEAIDCYLEQQGQYDIIFMDCEMPVVDGFEATEKILTLAVEHNYPAANICALTAHAMIETKARCLNIGMSRVLTKPIKIEEISALLNNLATEKAQQQDTGA
ncbi:hybrid sensor histidine kinase/response regulator [Oceanicoccus sp. KOV_DT_Chl]|uniref:hybrid sensor histidine kinase/response regulator n=1 Tax=Oceanicoccus sp. KOV_DT_Chl TaxID=1904639 RepID=UPI0013576A24|nr:hybrid sensor histidine kinase/response regulator [Oceanicoccus sp. KOV_DT_Chl]